MITQESTSLNHSSPPGLSVTQFTNDVLRKLEKLETTRQLVENTSAKLLQVSQIGEGNEIFEELAILVNDQRIIIDDIGSHIKNSHAATAQGRAQLAKAARNQRSISSMTCLLLVIFGIILLIIIVFVKMHIPHRKSDLGLLLLFPIGFRVERHRLLTWYQSQARVKAARVTLPMLFLQIILARKIPPTTGLHVRGSVKMYIPHRKSMSSRVNI